MDEDSDILHDDTAVEVPGQRWHWSFLLMRTVCLGANVANAFGSYLIDVATDIGAHANRQIEQDARNDFRSEVEDEIEALLSQED